MKSLNIYILQCGCAFVCRSSRKRRCRFWQIRRSSPGACFRWKSGALGAFQVEHKFWPPIHGIILRRYFCVCGAAPSSIAGNFCQTKRPFASSGPNAPAAYYFLITSAPLCEWKWKVRASKLRQVSSRIQIVFQIRLGLFKLRTSFRARAMVMWTHHGNTFAPQPRHFSPVMRARGKY
jgi:hypothetical protein